MSSDDFSKLREQYAETIPGKIQSVKAQICNLLEKPEEKTLESFKGEVHKIAGSAGLYGYPEASKLCKRIETECMDMLNNSGEIDLAWVTSLEKRFPKSLEEAFHNPSHTTTQCSEEIVKTDLCLLLDDEKLANEIAEKARARDLSIHTFKTPLEAKENLESEKFKPIFTLIQDSYFSDCNTAYTVIDKHKQSNSSSKAVFALYMKVDDLKERMTASHSGFDCVFPTSLDFETLFELVKSNKLKRKEDALNLLVIEDSVDVQNIISHSLQDLEVNCHMQNSGNEILERLKEIQPDLVILDHCLPGYYGLDLLQLVRSDMYFRDLPFILITAFVNDDIIKRAYDLGVYDFIEKPINPLIFKLRIANFVKQHQLTKRLSNP